MRNCFPALCGERGRSRGTCAAGNRLRADGFGVGRCGAQRGRCRARSGARREEAEVHEPARMAVLAAPVPRDPATVRRERERALPRLDLARPERELVGLGLGDGGSGRGCGPRRGRRRGASPGARRALGVRGAGVAGLATGRGGRSRIAGALTASTAAGSSADGRCAPRERAAALHPGTGEADGREPDRGAQLASDRDPEPERGHAAALPGGFASVTSRTTAARRSRGCPPRVRAPRRTPAPEPARNFVDSRVRAVSSQRSERAAADQRTPPWPRRRSRAGSPSHPA